MAKDEVQMAVTQMALIKKKDLIPVATKLTRFLQGDREVIIGGDPLYDFFEEFKRLKTLAENALKAVEMYAGEIPTERFTFSKASEKAEITSQEELIRVLREDFGWTDAQILECSKVDANALAEKLGYTKKGLAEAIPSAVELKLNKSRMMVK